MLYILRSEDVRVGKNILASRQEVSKSLLILNTTYTTISTIDTRYVRLAKVIGKYPSTVYRTKVASLRNSLTRAELRYIGKFKRLVVSGTITPDAFQKAVQSYNRYVLVKSVAVLYASAAPSDALGNTAYDEIEAIYALKIKLTSPVSVTPIPTPVIPVALPKVGDYYSLTKNLQFGISDPEVMKLQTILRHYGYISNEPTNYFGDITRKALIKFADEKLGIKNSNGVFDATVRNALLNLNW